MLKNSKLKEAMSKLGSLGGKANIRINGKEQMSAISRAYWASPAGRNRSNKRLKTNKK